MTSTRQWIILVIFILVCLGAGAIGSLFTTPAIPTWYAGLNKPAWNPPSWVFAPVWTFLYITMGIAAWLVWKERGLSGAAVPLSIFVMQLIFNVLWSIIFFGMQNIVLAMLDIVILWGLILAIIIMFFRIVPAAGWLLVPYILWVTYAATLNCGIWRLNR